MTISNQAVAYLRTMKPDLMCATCDDLQVQQGVVCVTLRSVREPRDGLVEGDCIHAAFRFSWFKSFFLFASEIRFPIPRRFLSIRHFTPLIPRQSFPFPLVEIHRNPWSDPDPESMGSLNSLNRFTLSRLPSIPHVWWMSCWKMFEITTLIFSGTDPLDFFFPCALDIP